MAKFQLISIYANVSFNFFVLYKDAPVINVGVVDQTLNEGDTALFTCQASGTPMPKIVWYFNGAPVDKANTMKYVISEVLFNPTTKNTTLKILNADSSDIGAYTCNATNVVSSDTSSGMLDVDGEFIIAFCHIFI